MKIIISIEILGRWIENGRYSYDDDFDVVIGYVVGNALLFLITVYFWVCTFSYFKYLRNEELNTIEESQEIQELKSMT